MDIKTEWKSDSSNLFCYIFQSWLGSGQTLLLILNTNFVAAAERGLQCDYSLFMAYVNRAADDKASIAVSRTAEWIWGRRDPI